MTLKPTTGPYMLMVGGLLLLAAGLVGTRLSLITFGIALLGLGFWSLRGLSLKGALVGPVLLGASGVALAIAGFIAGQVIMFAMAFAAVGLACFAWLRTQG